jgi:hypothetical protein
MHIEWIELTNDAIDYIGHESRFAVGNGPNYVQKDHPQDGVQEAQNVRNFAGDGADAASVDGKTYLLTHAKLNRGGSLSQVDVIYRSDHFRYSENKVRRFTEESERSLDVDRPTRTI